MSEEISISDSVNPCLKDSVSSVEVSALFPSIKGKDIMYSEDFSVYEPILSGSQSFQSSLQSNLVCHSSASAVTCGSEAQLVSASSDMSDSRACFDKSFQCNAIQQSTTDLCTDTFSASQCGSWVYADYANEHAFQI